MAYTDIDKNFRKLVSGGVAIKRDSAAVSQFIENLLLTQQGEKPFNSSYGTSVMDYLRESVNVLNTIAIKDTIASALEIHAKHLNIKKRDISVTADRVNDVYDVQIRYSVDDNDESETINFQLGVSR